MPGLQGLGHGNVPCHSLRAGVSGHSAGRWGAVISETTGEHRAVLSCVSEVIWDRPQVVAFGATRVTAGLDFHLTPWPPGRGRGCRWCQSPVASDLTNRARVMESP